MHLKPRKPTSRKGENGRVLVVGGSIEYTGAVYLAGQAAFRAGVDIVVVAAPENVAWAINALSPDFITRKFKGDYLKDAGEIEKLSRKFDVTLIGNGLGRNVQTLKFARQACRKIKGLKVIDADAIAAIKLQDVQNSLITPHPGEYSLLMRNSRCNDFKEVQEIIGSNVIFLKGHVKAGKKYNVAISAEKIKFMKSGNPGMTVGGTGDILAGLAAGILAQEKDLFKAAMAAAYANQAAADKLKAKYGWGFTASDLLEALPAGMKKLWLM